MIICKLKHLKIYQKKHKIIFLYFYGDWCDTITHKIDSFFKEKYDLNKIYIKVPVDKGKSILNAYDITSYPIINIYEFDTLLSTLYCNCHDILTKINIVYNNI